MNWLDLALSLFHLVCLGIKSCWRGFPCVTCRITQFIPTFVTSAATENCPCVAVWFPLSLQQSCLIYFKQNLVQILEEPSSCEVVWMLMQTLGFFRCLWPVRWIRRWETITVSVTAWRLPWPLCWHPLLCTQWKQTLLQHGAIISSGITDAK